MSYLVDFRNFNSFLSAIAKTESEIKAAGRTVDSSAVAWAILNGIGTQYPFHRTNFSATYIPV